MAYTDSFGKNITTGITKKLNSLFHNPYSKVNINWFSIKYLKHLPSNELHTHRLFDHPTLFYDGHEFLHGITEIFIDEVYKQSFPENANIIDCGANIGLSVIYVKRHCPTANIIAFEPDNKNYELLSKNIQSHNVTNVQLRKEAVWIEDTMISFREEGNMGSKIEQSKETGHLMVKAVRLKNFLQTKVDFLKLDIEGAEYQVLLDIKVELKNVNNLFVEYHGLFNQSGELIEIFNILRNAGFNFYIKEATSVYNHPFIAKKTTNVYDVQLNIFCFRN